MKKKTLQVRIELTTSRLTVGRSNQLSYGTYVVSDIIVYNYSARVMYIRVQGEESNSARVSENDKSIAV